MRLDVAGTSLGSARGALPGIAPHVRGLIAASTVG